VQTIGTAEITIDFDGTGTASLPARSAKAWNKYDSENLGPVVGLRPGVENYKYYRFGTG